MLDFQQQDPTFDPEWATNYLSQYLSSDSNTLYCPVCNVQFSSLHNKQQHCLGRKHNKEVITFVQKSVRMHQKNGNIPTSGSYTNAENCAKSPTDHMRNITNHDASLVGPVISHTEDNIKDCVSNTVDHMDNTEDGMTHHTSIGKDHITNAKDHVNNTEDHMSSAGEFTNGTICEDYITPTINNCNENSLSNTLNHTDTVVDYTDANNSSTTSVSNIGASEAHVIMTDSHMCSSIDHTNNVLVREDTHDQSFVNFPSHYTLNHVIHDFTSHQQGEQHSLVEN